MDLRIRFDYGNVVPWVRTVDGRLQATAGPNALVLDYAGPPPRRRLLDGGGLRRRGRRPRCRSCWRGTRRTKQPPRTRRRDAPLPRHRAAGGTDGCSRPRDAAKRPPSSSCGRSSRSRRSRTRRRAGSSPRPPRRCRSGSAACATGTTGTAGCATPCSRSARSWSAGTTSEAHGLARLAAARGCGRAVEAPDHVQRHGRAPTHRVRGRRGSPATRARRRCGSATRPATSSSSTCTARRSRRCTSCAQHVPARATTTAPPTRGRSRPRCSSSSKARGTSPTTGIWEVRGGRQHFTHSKVMAWLAFDCAVRSAELFDLPPRSTAGARRATRSTTLVCDEGYNAELGSFTQAFGSTQLDAALLQLPMVGFLPPTDDRIVGTVAAIERELLRDGFVLRYRSETRRRRIAPGRGCVPAVLVLARRQLRPAGPDARGAQALFDRLAAAHQRRRPLLRGVRPALRAAAREHAPSVHASRVRAGGQAGHRGRAREPPVLTGHRVSRTTARAVTRRRSTGRERARQTAPSTRCHSERPRVRLARRPTCARSGDAPRRDCIAAPDAQRVLPRQGMGRVRRGGDPARRDARHRPGPDRRALDEGARDPDRDDRRARHRSNMGDRSR